MRGLRSRVHLRLSPSEPAGAFHEAKQAFFSEAESLFHQGGFNTSTNENRSCNTRNVLWTLHLHEGE